MSERIMIIIMFHLWIFAHSIVYTLYTEKIDESPIRK